MGARQRRLLHLVLIAVAAAGVVVLLVFHGPNWAQVGHALARMSWWWAAAAVFLNFVSAVARAMSWDNVINEAVPPPHPRRVDVISAFFVGIFANGVLPGRVGEVARIGVLMRRMPERDRPGLWPAMIGSVLAHRILEVFPSIALIFWVLIEAHIQPAARTALWGVAGAGVAFVAIGVALARRHEQGGVEAKDRFGALLARLREGLGILRRPIPSLVSAGWQTLAWLLQLGAVYVTLLAFNIHLPLVAAAAVLAVMNVALVLPLWPGNLGVTQFAIAIPLAAYGIPTSRAIAYGLALQAIESSVGYTFGIVCLAREGLSLGRLRAMSARRADTI
ncbi:MAG TPA: lysylphosphatidylglycerol synthase transmembrane domain-containing protein [Gaiellaceae bacterium]